MYNPWKKKKFKNLQVKSDGKVYGSKLENAVRYKLEEREKLGEIKIIRTQQHIHWYSQGIKQGEYWPDFTCWDLVTKEVFWVEAKGYPNEKWPRNLHMWEAGGPGILEIWTGSYKNPKQSIIVLPVSVGHHTIHEQVFGKLEIPGEI